MGQGGTPPEPSVIGDFNKDKQADVILQVPSADPGKGYVMAALMTNGIYTGKNKTLFYVYNPSERVVAANDFNRDGYTEIVTQSGQAVKVRNGGNFNITMATFNLPAGETIIASGDIKGNGKWPDLLTRNGTNYTVFENVTQGSLFSNAGLFYTQANGYKIAGLGHFITNGSYSDVLMINIFGTTVARPVNNLNNGGVLVPWPGIFVNQGRVVGCGDFIKGATWEILSTNTLKEIRVGLNPSAFLIPNAAYVVGPK